MRRGRHRLLLLLSRMGHTRMHVLGRRLLMVRMMMRMVMMLLLLLMRVPAVLPMRMEAATRPHRGWAHGSRDKVGRHGTSLPIVHLRW